MTFSASLRVKLECPLGQQNIPLESVERQALRNRRDLKNHLVLPLTQCSNGFSAQISMVVRHS